MSCWCFSGCRSLDFVVVVIVIVVIADQSIELRSQWLGETHVL